MAKKTTQKSRKPKSKPNRDAFYRAQSLAKKYRCFEIVHYSVLDELSIHEDLRREFSPSYEKMFVAWHDGDNFFNHIRQSMMDACLIFKVEGENKSMANDTKKLFNHINQYVKKVLVEYRTDWENCYEKAYGI